jgi:hypothetical protein
MTKRRHRTSEPENPDASLNRQRDPAPRLVAPPKRRPWLLLASVCLFAMWLVILIWLAFDATH